MGLSFAFSVCAAFTGWVHLFLALSAVLAGVGLTTWLVVAARYNQPISKLLEVISQGEDIRGLKTRSGGPTSLIAREILETRSRYGRAVETCYSLAAVMCHAGHTICGVKGEILRAIGELRTNCSELATGFAELKSEPARDVNRGSSVPSVLEEIVSGADQMSQVLTQVHHDARDLLTSVEETAYSMSRLDSFLQEMTRSGKNLETSTETANRVALEGTKAFEELEKENEAIIVSVKEAGAAVDDLGGWSEEVGKIVEVIHDITDETNLLALNAAIIAAQAGEHGKAFGVVAEEIRGLAERTNSSTKEISDLVKAVQKNVANVAQSMRKSLQSVERGDILARNAGKVLDKIFDSFESSRNLAKEIAASTFEHKIDSSSIVKSIHRVTDIAKRLEANELRDLQGGRTSIVTAKVLEALWIQGNGSLPGLQAAGAGPKARAHPAACAVGLQEGGDNVIRVIEKSEHVLRRTKFTLDSIGEKVVACIGTIEKATGLARSLVRKTIVARGRIAGRCWEIVGCSENLRSECQAYKEDDWRCFLVDGVACFNDKENEVHGGRQCYDCPAFRRNLECLLAGISDNSK